MRRLNGENCSIQLAKKQDVPEEWINQSIKFTNEAVKFLLKAGKKYGVNVVINGMQDVHVNIVFSFCQKPEVLKLIMEAAHVNMDKKMQRLIESLPELKQLMDKENHNGK